MLFAVSIEHFTGAGPGSSSPNCSWVSFRIAVRCLPLFEKISAPSTWGQLPSYIAMQPLVTRHTALTKTRAVCKRRLQGLQLIIVRDGAIQNCIEIHTCLHRVIVSLLHGWSRSEPWILTWCELNVCTIKGSLRAMWRLVLLRKHSERRQKNHQDLYWIWV